MKCNRSEKIERLITKVKGLTAMLDNLCRLSEMLLRRILFMWSMSLISFPLIVPFLGFDCKGIEVTSDLNIFCLALQLSVASGVRKPTSTPFVVFFTTRSPSTELLSNKPLPIPFGNSKPKSSLSKYNRRCH